MKARGPLTYILLALAPVIMWLLGSAGLGSRWADPTAALTGIAVVAGLAGASAFALNLVLGGRWGFVDAYFGGLDKMYQFHRRSGEAALILLACHGALVVWSRGTVDGAAALALFDPGADLTVFFGVLALTLTAVVLLTILFARLNHEVFVYVHRVIGIAYLVAALHIFGTPGTPLPTPVTLYLALLTVLGLASWLYRSWFSSVLVKRHDFAVAEVKKLDPSVVEIGMEPADGPLSFTPGQFVFVTFYSSKFNAQFHPVSVAQKGEYALITLRPGDARDQFHPFSLTSSPRDRRLRITVKAVGDFTGALHSLDRGAVARVEGPYGRFSYVNVSNRRQVWIAGGIGVTPFLSMARSLEGDTYDIDLYYGYKRREEAFFLEELTAIARASSSLNLVPVPEDEKGFISADMIERTSGALRERDVFICGPPAMIEIITRQLGDKRVPRRQIHFEKFAFGRPRV